MSDKQKILELSAKFLENYLDKFVNDGISQDLRTEYQENINPGMNLSPMYTNLISNKSMTKTVDKIKTRYSHIMHQVPITPMKSILEQVCLLDDSLIIDVGSRVGERFGLFVANRNPNSQVYVFNPFREEEFISQENLFDELDRTINYHSDNYGIVNLTNLTESIHQFYSDEGLHNIEFKREYFSKEALEKIKEKHPSKRIVIHSHRTPTLPKDITYDLSEMVNSYGVDVIMTPLINTPIGENNNPLLKKINDNYKKMIRMSEENKDVRDQFYNIMTLYYALNIAMISDVDVYQKRTLKSPYQHPNFIVSTIKPIQNPR